MLDTRLTANNGTFTRFELTKAVAAALPGSLSIEMVEASVHQALASAQIVAIGDHSAHGPAISAPTRMVPDDRALHYTMRSLLAIEERLLHQLRCGVGDGDGVLDQNLVEATILSSKLGPDQTAAVRDLTASGVRVAVMVGRAGTGKTHTLATVRTVYAAAGYSVVGLAPSARAARELESGSGIVSSTIARHLVEQRDVDATTLVVVDEAAMASVRDLAAVIDQATRAGAKVLLVGDHHHLPEVAVGGGFRAALDTLGERVVELTVNRRQQHEWERAALDELRCGQISAVFTAYQDHGRVVVADDPQQLHARAIADWQRLRSTVRPCCSLEHGPKRHY